MVHEKRSFWWCQDLNSGPLGHESSALTTRPRRLALNHLLRDEGLMSIEPVCVRLSDDERDVPAIHGGVQSGLVQLELDGVTQEQRVGLDRPELARKCFSWFLKLNILHLICLSNF